MKKTLLYALLLFLLIIPSLLYAAGSACTTTYTPVYSSEGTTGLSTLTFEWTSDDSTGAVSAATSSVITDQIAGKYITMVLTVPGSSAPTALYDITITSSYGGDVMGGVLADRSATAIEQAFPYIGASYGPSPVSTALTLNVTNAGNSKTGKVIVYLSK